MADTLEIFGKEFQNVTGIIATDDNGNELAYTRGGTYQTVNKTYTPTTSQQTETITAGTGYDAIEEVNVTVNAMPSGSVTAPSSISGTSATVSTGTNTLTLSKTVSVTPNVTTAGYVSSGTAGNSAVSLTASVTTKGAATITPGTTNQTISSGTYLTGAQTISGDAGLVAGNIKSGVTIFNVTGTYTGGGGGGMNKQIYFGSDQVAANTYTATDVKLKVAVTGTYKISWCGWRNTTSGTSGSQLYKNGTAIGTANTSFTITNYGQVVTLTGISLAANDDIVVYARARSAQYQMRVANLCIEQTS